MPVVAYPPAIVPDTPTTRRSIRLQLIERLINDGDAIDMDRLARIDRVLRERPRTLHTLKMSAPASGCVPARVAFFHSPKRKV